MSGYTNDAVIRHGVLDSTIAFLQEPITPAGLLGRVGAVLDAPPDRRSVASGIPVARARLAES